MRLPAVSESKTLSEPVVPATVAERTVVQTAAEPVAPRFLAWLDQLDPDQRVRAVGEW